MNEDTARIANIETVKNAQIQPLDVVGFDKTILLIMTR